MHSTKGDFHFHKLNYYFLIERSKKCEQFSISKFSYDIILTIEDLIIVLILIELHIIWTEKKEVKCDGT